MTFLTKMKDLCLSIFKHNKRIELILYYFFQHMIPSTTLPKVNKNCVYCVAKIKDSYYVLSDETYIHKPCL